MTKFFVVIACTRLFLVLFTDSPFQALVDQECTENAAAAIEGLHQLPRPQTDRDRFRREKI